MTKVSNFFQGDQEGTRGTVLPVASKKRPGEPSPWSPPPGPRFFPWSCFCTWFFVKIYLPKKNYYAIIKKLKTLINRVSKGRKEVSFVKEGIHPKYQEATVRCACGETFTTGSVKEEIKVEICSKCHPFFTGKQKFVDTGGRVERFKRKFNLETEE